MQKHAFFFQKKQINPHKMQKNSFDQPNILHTTGINLQQNKSQTRKNRKKVC